MERGEEGQGEIGPSVQQVRRATAEMAAQSETKVSVVCDHLPGPCDELAEHIEAPRPQATVMQEESAAPATTCVPFATPAADSLLPAKASQTSNEQNVEHDDRGQSCKIKMLQLRSKRE